MRKTALGGIVLFAILNVQEAYAMEYSSINPIKSFLLHIISYVIFISLFVLGIVVLFYYYYTNDEIIREKLYPYISILYSGIIGSLGLVVGYFEEELNTNRPSH